MRRKQKDHLTRQQSATRLTRDEKKALAIILLGVVVFAVSMVTMGGDTSGVQSSRERMGIQLEAWVTLDGRPLPSITAVLGIGSAILGVVLANRAHARRPSDKAA